MEENSKSAYCHSWSSHRPGRSRSRCRGAGTDGRPRGWLREPVDGAVERGDVDAAVCVLAEGRNEGDGKPLGPIAAGRREAEVQRAQLADAEVRIQVAAVKIIEGAIADHVAAGDRAWAGVDVRILEHGLGEGPRPCRRTPARTHPALGARPRGSSSRSCRPCPGWGRFRSRPPPSGSSRRRQSPDPPSAGRTRTATGVAAHSSRSRRSRPCSLPCR